VIIASKAKEALGLNRLGFILPKGDPGSLEKLREYVLNFTGLGDFVVSDDEGREIRRARNIRDIYEILLEAGEDTDEGRRLRALLEAFAEKDKFSTWLYMHSYRELGDRLRPKKSRGQQLIALLKRHFRLELSRVERTPLAGIKVFDLAGLLAALRAVPPETLQPYSDNDILSSWLDRKGFSELAEQLRPIHGKGPELKALLMDIVAKWRDIYRARGEGSPRPVL
jgi:hypothetical protein